MPHKYWSPELLPALRSISILNENSLRAGTATTGDKLLTNLRYLEAELQKLTFCLTKVKFRVSDHGRSQTARRYGENDTLHPVTDDDVRSTM
jgi:hypothetical protein